MWKTDLAEQDFAHVSYATGWIKDGHGKGAKNTKVNMSLNPGEWKLWIGSVWGSQGWAVPKTPVVTVTVN